MSASTLLLYTTSTGHVLGAATVVAPLNGQIQPEALAGQFLPVRHNGDPSAPVFTDPVMMIPASELSIHSVDAAAVSIAAARATFIDLEKQTPHPLLFTTATAPTVVLGTNSITVHFTPASATKTLVWARVDAINPASAVPSQIVSIEVTPPNTAALNVVLALNILPHGTYGVLALVPGFVPVLQKITV